jgi:peptidoglycan/xylan/chitin deacetylase (PgdA/CDA1 family)|tara:strand:+ start:666 stop:914 length:249 start_codon:yes stop_codon:yes gene_type:complete
MKIKTLLLFLLCLGNLGAEKKNSGTVVLTFDDSVASQATYVAPLLKKHGFGATFFITEGFGGPICSTESFPLTLSSSWHSIQ